MRALSWLVAAALAASACDTSPTETPVADCGTGGVAAAETGTHSDGGAIDSGIDAVAPSDAAVAFDAVRPFDAVAPFDAFGGDLGLDTTVIAPSDATASCRAHVLSTGCSPVRQMAPLVTEMRVATAPPVTTAGWYPGGIFTLTSATVYTGPGGATGPDGLRYAVTLSVRGMGSVDDFQFTWSQAGCPESTYAFSGDTVGDNESLVDVTWMCPPCPTCMRTMPYSGTLTTFLIYRTLPDGSTLALNFEAVPVDGGANACGVMGLACCAGGMCGPGTICLTNGTCGPGVASDGGAAGCGAPGQPCCLGGMCGAGGVCNGTICAGGGGDGGGTLGCGMPGQVCCPVGMCGPGYTCASNVCSAMPQDGGTPSCGVAGRPCCDAGTCNPGYTCVSGNCRP